MFYLNSNDSEIILYQASLMQAIVSILILNDAFSLNFKKKEQDIVSHFVK